MLYDFLLGTQFLLVEETPGDTKGAFDIYFTIPPFYLIKWRPAEPSHDTMI